MPGASYITVAERDSMERKYQEKCTGREKDMFGKKKQEKKGYDANVHKPVIRSSICTGEKVAGFKSLENGKFEEIMLIRTEEDFRSFLDMYGIAGKDVSTEY